MALYRFFVNGPLHVGDLRTLDEATSFHMSRSLRVLVKDRVYL